MKHMLYGDGSTMDLTFNSRLQPATFAISGKISKSYSYHDDGALRFSSDSMDHRFDRSYAFDHAGRLKSAFSGAEARGEGTTTNRPYNQTYGYDAFGHLTQRTVKTWWTGDATVSNTYVNNRQQVVNWQYDADGRLLNGNDGYSYDAAGRNVYVETSNFTTATMSFDGDGRQAKTVETYYDEEWNQYTETKYYVRSTVLSGQVVNEIDDFGAVLRTFVYAGPAVFGWLWHTYSGAFMTWEQRDPSGATDRSNGEKELDPLGGDAGTFATSVIPSDRVLLPYGDSYSSSHFNFGYSIDGVRTPVGSVVAAKTTAFRFTIGVEGFPLGPMIDWYPGFLDWLERKKKTMTAENYLTLGEEWLKDSVAEASQDTRWASVDPDGIRDALDRMLRTGGCGQFVKELINRLGTKRNPFVSDDVLDLFDTVARQGGFVRGGLADKIRVSGTVSGHIFNGKKRGGATIYLNSNFEFGSSDPTAQAAAVNVLDAFSVLHELIHHAGLNDYYTDRQVAVALSEMTDAPGLPNRKDYKSEKAFMGANSSYFSKVLAQKCPFLSR